MHLRRPHIVNPPTRHLVLVLLPPQRALAFQCLQPPEFRQPIQSLIGNRPVAIRAAQKDPAIVLIWFGAPSGRDALGVQPSTPIDSRAFREMGVWVESFLIGRCAAAAVRQLHHCVPAEVLDDFGTCHRLVELMVLDLVLVLGVPQQIVRDLW